MDRAPIRVIVRVRPFKNTSHTEPHAQTLRVKEGKVISVPKPTKPGSRLFQDENEGVSFGPNNKKGKDPSPPTFESWAAASMGPGRARQPPASQPSNIPLGSSLPPGFGGGGGNGSGSGLGSGKGALNFEFDRVLDCSKTDGSKKNKRSKAALASEQAAVYEEIGEELLDAVWEGYHCSVFSYGQTGAGKTYTMVGDEIGSGREGFIPRFATALLSRMEEEEGVGGKSYAVELSLLEIYNEQLSDLLEPKSSSSAAASGRLRIREDPDFGPYCPGLTRVQVRTPQQAVDLVRLGFASRSTSSTSHNVVSSRSHAVLTLTFSQKWRDPDTGLIESQISRINLVDLAGSERLGSLEKRNGVLLKETGEINKSLLCLSRVITQLSSAATSGSDETHVSYRDSALTWLLRESLGGNSKTVMIASVAPDLEALEETRNTLRYAARASHIVNTAMVNIDPRVQVIADLRAQVKALQAAATPARTAGTWGATGDSPLRLRPRGVLCDSTNLHNNSSTIEDDDFGGRGGGGGASEAVGSPWMLMGPGTVVAESGGVDAETQTTTTCDRDDNDDRVGVEEVETCVRLEEDGAAWFVSLSGEAYVGEEVVVRVGGKRGDGDGDGDSVEMGEAPHKVKVVWDAEAGVATLTPATRYAHCVIHTATEPSLVVGRGETERIVPGDTFTLGQSRTWWFRGPAGVKKPPHVIGTLVTSTPVRSGPTPLFETLMTSWPTTTTAGASAGAGAGAMDAMDAMVENAVEKPQGMEELEALVVQMEAEKKEMERRAQEAERRAQEAERRAQDSEQRVKELARTDEARVEEMAGMSVEIAALKQAVIDAKASVDATQTVRKQIKLEELESELASYRSEAAELNALVTRNAKAQRKMKETLAATEDRAESAEMELAGVSAELAATQEEAASACKEMENVIASQGMQLEELSDQISFLTKELEKRRNPGNVQTPTKSLQLVVGRLKGQLAEKDATEAELRAQLGKSRDELATLRASVEGLKSQASGARTELAASLAANKAAADASASERARLGSQRLELERGQETLEASLKEMKARVASLEARAESAEAAAASATCQVLELEAELSKPGVLVHVGSGHAKLIHAGRDECVEVLRPALVRAAGGSGGKGHNLFVALNNGEDRSERVLREEEVPLEMLELWGESAVLRSFHFRAKGRIKVYIGRTESYKTLFLHPDTTATALVAAMIERCASSGVPLNGEVDGVELLLDDRLASVVSAVDPGVMPMRVLSQYPVHEHKEIRFFVRNRISAITPLL